MRKAGCSRLTRNQKGRAFSMFKRKNPDITGERTVPLPPSRKSCILIWLLLCSLFLSGYSGLLNTNGLTPYDLLADSAASGGNLSPLSGGMRAGYADLFAAPDADSWIKSLLPIYQSRWLPAKSNCTVAAAMAALMTCLLCSSSLIRRFSIPFNSLSITIFLHEKDGMK